MKKYDATNVTITQKNLILITNNVQLTQICNDQI